MPTAAAPRGSTSIASCGIAVMAKASQPGRTKTRLVPPLTFGQAAQCNTAFLRDTVDNILAAAARISISGYVAFGPPQARAFFVENLPGRIGLVEAWCDDFGECLFSAIAQLLELGHDSAVVLNSDSPTLPTSLLIETARVLATPGDRVVLGPANDGGYYLLGMKRKHRRLFEDIAWSTERVTAQTLERAAELELAVHLLPQWYDVDDIESLKRLQAELLRSERFVPDLLPNRPKHTRALLGPLMRNASFLGRGNDAFERAAE